VLLGAYLFGGVTMLQFHLQGIGQCACQFLTMMPYISHHRGAGADLAQPDLDRINMPPPSKLTSRRIILL
jgi:simple sugar transport system permease protein